MIERLKVTVPNDTLFLVDQRPASEEGPKDHSIYKKETTEDTVG